MSIKQYITVSKSVLPISYLAIEPFLIGDFTGVLRSEQKRIKVWYTKTKFPKKIVAHNLNNTASADRRYIFFGYYAYLYSFGPDHGAKVITMAKFPSASRSMFLNDIKYLADQYVAGYSSLMIIHSDDW